MVFDPQALIRQIGFPLGSIIADFGAGNGTVAKEVARSVGSMGRVYAIDVQKSLLDRFAAELKALGISNIETIWADIELPEGTKLRPAAVDAVLIMNILFQLPDRAVALQEASRILRPHGMLIVVDWKDSFGGVGPRAQDIVRQVEVERILSEKGFTKAKDLDAGMYHWGTVWVKTS